jgi:hypothetical protein
VNAGPTAATIESVLNVPQISNLYVYTVDIFTTQAGNVNQVVHTFGPNDPMTFRT